MRSRLRRAQILHPKTRTSLVRNVIDWPPLRPALLLIPLTLFALGFGLPRMLLGSARHRTKPMLVATRLRERMRFFSASENGGGANTAIGYHALYLTTADSANTAVGVSSLAS